AAAAAMFRARRLLQRFAARPALPPPPRARGYAEPAAGPAPMAFTFASPTQVFYNGANVKQVDVPTLTGSFGILASHVPTLQVLKPGVVTVYAEDGTATKYFVSSGSVTVHADSTVQVLAEEAVTMDMLDLAVSPRPPRAAPCLPRGRDDRGGFAPHFSRGGRLPQELPVAAENMPRPRAAPSPRASCHPLMGIKGSELLLGELSTGCGERKLCGC
uniref:ATP synthase F(1) complex subunit delta, mitochondrial n=1 Tax=Strix occidentalis caurina TaxID=311401 RepID=A0A8D0EMR1_STROC